MIKSALLHALFAVIIQLLVALFTDYCTGAVAGVMYYFGREVAQHEYKGGGPKAVKWYYGFVNHWNLDSTLDVLLPIIATGVVCILM